MPGPVIQVTQIAEDIEGKVVRNVTQLGNSLATVARLKGDDACVNECLGSLKNVVETCLKNKNKVVQSVLVESSPHTPRNNKNQVVRSVLLDPLKESAPDALPSKTLQR